MRQSHQTQFGLVDITRVTGPTLLALIGVIILLHGLDRLDWAPKPRPLQTMDEVVFEHRRSVARSSTADVLIIGDSSSAIDVEAPLLESLLPGASDVANQGLLMGLPLPLYAEPAAGIVSRRTPHPTHVVLLLTPRFLTREISSPYHVRLWRQLEDQRNVTDDQNYPVWTSLEIARERLVIPMLPWSTHGRAGVFLPYVRISQDHIVEHQGSRYDVGWYNPPPGERLNDWTIRPVYLQEARRMREVLEEDAVLYVGLTPLPESAVAPGFKPLRDQMLLQLNASLGADVVLTNLPATLPNGFCATEVHLNRRGAAYYTGLLAGELIPHLDSREEKNP